MGDEKSPYYHDQPIDRLLRKVVERDTYSYPAELRLKHAQLLGKHIDTTNYRIIDEWVGDQPVYRPEPPRPKLAMFFDRPYDPLWDESSY